MDKMRRLHHGEALSLLWVVLAAFSFFLACGSDPAPERATTPAEGEGRDTGSTTQPDFDRRDFDRRDSDRGPLDPALAPRKGGNQPPVITWVNLEPSSPSAGGTVRVTAAAADAEGDRLEISYTWRLNGKPIRGAGDSVSLEDTKRGDILEVSVSAGDGRSVSTPHTISVELRNRPPEVTAVRIVPDPKSPPGGKLRAVATATDADGDALELTYRWNVNGGTVPGDGPELETTVGHGDWVTLRVIARDGADDSEPFDLPDVQIENAAPLIVSMPGAPGSDGVFRYQVEAEDVDKDRPFRFSLEKAPEGMTVNEQTGVVEWLPGAKQAGRHTIEIAVHDSRGASATQSFELTVGEEELAVGEEETADGAKEQRGG